MSTVDPSPSRPLTAPTVPKVLALFALIATLLTLSGWWGATHWSHGEYSRGHGLSMPTLLRHWYEFDGGWYELIANKGYVHTPNAQSTVAFFPGYPLAVRAVKPLFGGDSATAGSVLTLMCGIGSVALFTVWCRRRMTPLAAWLSVGLLLVYPYSWYLYGPIYADSFFLLATLSAFLLVEDGHPIWAGLFGAVATVTRPVAPAVLIGLLLLVAERRGALVYFKPSGLTGTASRGIGPRIRRFIERTGAPRGLMWGRLRPADAGVLLAGTGFAAYLGYLWVRFGDPFIWASVQRYWNQPSGPVTLLKLHLGGLILFRLGSRFRYIVGCVLQGTLTCSGLLLVPRVVRRFGWGYAMLVAIGMGMAFIGSKDFQGTGRYLLAAFPVFGLGGEWLSERSARTRGAILTMSAVLLLFWANLYSRGYYVA